MLKRSNVMFAALAAAFLNLPSVSAAQRDESGPSTFFNCYGYPNNRQDVMLWASVHANQLTNEMRWSNGLAIRLERARPNLMKYEIWYQTQKITDGTVKGSVIQFAMTAGGVELHCHQAKETN